MTKVLEDRPWNTRGPPPTENLEGHLYETEQPSLGSGTATLENLEKYLCGFVTNLKSKKAINRILEGISG